GAKESGRSSAEVQFTDYGFGAEYFTIEFPFLQECIDIGSLHPTVPGDPRIARTIRAQAFTKWEMEVQTDALPFIRLVECPVHYVRPCTCVKVSTFPKRHCRIAGVSRNRNIILAEQRIDRWTHNCPKLSP